MNKKQIQEKNQNLIKTCDEQLETIYHLSKLVMEQYEALQETRKSLNEAILILNQIRK